MWEGINLIMWVLCSILWNKQQERSKEDKKDKPYEEIEAHGIP